MGEIINAYLKTCRKEKFLVWQAYDFGERRKLSTIENMSYFTLRYFEYILSMLIGCRFVLVRPG